MEIVDYIVESEEVERERKFLVLVIYDIIDNNKRVRFSKFLESYGVRIQKSAFEAYIPQKLYEKLIKEIPKRISNEDNVRVYKVHENNEILQFGVVIDYEKDDTIIF